MAGGVQECKASGPCSQIGSVKAKAKVEVAAKQLPEPASSSRTPPPPPGLRREAASVSCTLPAGSTKATNQKSLVRQMAIVRTWASLTTTYQDIALGQSTLFLRIGVSNFACLSTSSLVEVTKFLRSPAVPSLRLRTKPCPQCRRSLYLPLGGDGLRV